MYETPPTRLSAFIGRSFLEYDKQVWYDLRDMLDTLRPIGFVYEDAKEAQVRPISEKVRALILRNDVYIGVLTRRYPIAEDMTFLDRCGSVFTPSAPNRWTTSEWVVEEIGFAIGKDRPVILLIEEGVVFPTADLDADTEWVPFRRGYLSASQSSLTSMIANLIGRDIPAPASGDATTTDSPPVQDANTPPANVKSFSEQMQALREAASAGEVAKADHIQEDLLNAEADPETRAKFETFILGERARRGDGVALERLNSRLNQNLGDFDAVVVLSRVYASFGEHRKMQELLARSAPYIDPSLRAAYAAEEAVALRKDGKSADAIHLLQERLLGCSNDEERLTIWKALAYEAEAAKDKDLETSFLEKVMGLEPTNHDLRFRLAWLYGDTDRPKLAAYHYSLLVQKVGWNNARNNLAVAYGELSLNASQVEQYLMAMEKHDLSKANIASLYADAGFLAIAESYAKSVLQSTEEENASARAQHTLGEVTATRAREEEAIGKIDQESRTERGFMFDYAEGYCAAPIAAFSAVYKMPDGDIQISVTRAMIAGSANETRKWSGGLIALAMVNKLGSGPYLRRHVTKLKGNVTGRAGTFELRTDIFDPPESTKPETSRTTKGLFVIESDLQSIKLLERNDKRAEIIVASRVPAKN